MKRMVFGAAFVSLLLPVSGWAHGSDQHEHALDVRGPLVVAVATAEPAVQDDQALQRRRDVRQRRGMPMPADAGLQQPPQVTIPVVIEPPSTEAPPAEEPQKTFEQDNQELLKTLKRGGGQ